MWSSSDWTILGVTVLLQLIHAAVNTISYCSILKMCFATMASSWLWSYCVGMQFKAIILQLCYNNPSLLVIDCNQSTNLLCYAYWMLNVHNCIFAVNCNHSNYTNTIIIATMFHCTDNVRTSGANQIGWRYQSNGGNCTGVPQYDMGYNLWWLLGYTRCHRGMSPAGLPKSITSSKKTT